MPVIAYPCRPLTPSSLCLTNKNKQAKRMEEHGSATICELLVLGSGSKVLRQIGPSRMRALVVESAGTLLAFCARVY